jgi:hypothetical protein
MRHYIKSRIDMTIGQSAKREGRRDGHGNGHLGPVALVVEARTSRLHRTARGEFRP